MFRGEGYEVKTTDYTYTIAVCDALTSSVCGDDVGVCQTWGADNSKLLASTSDLSFQELTPAGTGISVSMGKGAYSGTCGKDNTGVIDFKCDQDVTSSSYTFEYVSTAECVTTFSISHCHACPGGCTSGPSPPSPPSPTNGPPSPPSPPSPPPSPGGIPAPDAGKKKKMDKTVKIALIVGCSAACFGILCCALAIRLRCSIAEQTKAHTVEGKYRPLSSSEDESVVFEPEPATRSKKKAYGSIPPFSDDDDDSGDEGGLLFDDDKKKAAQKRAESEQLAAAEAAPLPASAFLTIGPTEPQIECPGCASLNSPRAKYCAACGGDVTTGKKRKYLPMDTSLMAKFDRYGRPLPRGWRMGEDANGKYFFYNKRTHERTSRRPRHSDPRSSITRSHKNRL